MAINSLTLKQYHEICYFNLAQGRTLSVSSYVIVNLGAVIDCSSGDQLQDWVEVASLPDVEVRRGRWYGPGGEVMANGWTR
jgi:hypothetical protein